MRYKYIKKIGIVICSLTVGSYMIAATSPKEKYTCPTNNPCHIIANKEKALPKGYVPPNLVVPNIKFSFSEQSEKRYMQQEAAGAIEKLFQAGKKEGIHLAGVSGYRSYRRQTQLYSRYISRDGEAAANRYSATPGHSEHQTGLAMDVSSASNGYNLNERFGQTKEGKWLAANAHQYGFIIRYPKGKEALTGYIYEPWHIRYVGEDLAKYIDQHKLVLEQVEDCDGNQGEMELCVEEAGKIEHYKIATYKKQDIVLMSGRMLSKAIGANITYDKGTQKVTIDKEDNHITFLTGQKKMQVNGEEISIPTEAIVIDGNIYIPLRSLTEPLGYGVNWQQGKQVTLLQQAESITL